MKMVWRIAKKGNADPLGHLAMGADRRRHLGSYYIPSLVNTGMTGAEIELMRRSPDSVKDINNPANR